MRQDPSTSASAARYSLSRPQALIAHPNQAVDCQKSFMCWERYFLKCVVCGDRHLKYDFDKRCTFSSCNRNNPLIGKGYPQINQINTPDTCERCTTGSPPPSLPQQGAQGLEASSLALPPVPSQSVDPQISAWPAHSAPQPSKQCLRCFQSVNPVHGLKPCTICPLMRVLDAISADSMAN